MSLAHDWTSCSVRTDEPGGQDWLSLAAGHDFLPPHTNMRLFFCTYPLIPDPAFLVLLKKYKDNIIVPVFIGTRSCEPAI